MAWAARMVHSLLWQHRDPRRFLRALHNHPHQLWWPAWYARGLSSVLMGGIMWGAAQWMHGAIAPLWSYAILCLLLFQIASGFCITIMGEAQFWLLYAYSPFAILLAGLSGLSSVSSLCTLWGLQIGIPFYMGKLLVDACEIWSAQKIRAAANERRRKRLGGPSADLPALLLHQRTRWVRLGGAFIITLSLLYLYPTLEAQALFGYTYFGAATNPLHLGLSIISGCAACLGLDATLLALLVPLLIPVAGERWQTTYPARFALMIPPARLRPLFTPAVSSAAQSRALMTLFEFGYLAPATRRYVGALPASQLHALLLHLSLEDGGAAALHYLQPTLPETAQAWGALYAALADEAARPLDMQRWLSVLTHLLPHAPESDSPPIPTWNALLQARDALLLVTFDAPVAARATSALQQLAAFANHAPGAWPQALLTHLERHNHQLSHLWEAR